MVSIRGEDSGFNFYPPTKKLSEKFPEILSVIPDRQCDYRISGHIVFKNEAFKASTIRKYHSFGRSHVLDCVQVS